MKKIYIYLSSMFFISSSLQSQQLIIVGKVKCIQNTVNSTKGAENITVCPDFNPKKGAITASIPPGHFEINTGMSLSELEDKLVTIYAISRCKDCKEALRVFIHEDPKKNDNDPNQYCTLDDWLLNANCKQVEMKSNKADSALRVCIKQPILALDHVSPATAAVGAPTFLNLLSSASSVVGAALPTGAFEISTILPSKISYGKSFFSSPISNSANTGFNFVPRRDMSEAVFWNPSSLSFSRTSANISLLTNVKNNVKLSGFNHFTNKLAFGGGLLYTSQDEYRTAIFIRNRLTNPDTIKVDSTYMNLKEYAAFICGSYKLNNNVSFGLTIKSQWQDFNRPNFLFVEDINGTNKLTFDYNKTSEQHFDLDISATFEVNNSVQIGINLMNLVGTKSFADAFVSDTSSDKQIQNQRALGLGILYKIKRIHIGADALIANGGLYDVALGINYVPFNNALLSAGIAVKQLSYSVSFKIKYFRIAYINDNDFLINEKNKGKSSIFNGSIYGGFVFDF